MAGGSNILFNIGMAGAAAATADISGLITKFKQLKDAAYAAISASEDYYDVVNRSAVDMRLFNQETAGLIDTMASLKQANALTAAGIEVTAEQMSALGRFSAEYAQKTGKDITATFEQVTNAVIKGSERALLPFGIQLEETTDKTKAQAEALNKLIKEAEGVTVSAEDLNEKVYAFKNTIGTLSDQLAAPLFNNIMDGISGTENGFSGLSSALNMFSNDLTSGGQAFASWATSAEGALNIVSGMWAEITGNTEEATRLGEQYFMKLEQARQKERARRDEIAAQEAEKAQARADDQTLAMMAAENNAAAESEFGFGSGKKKGGGGGGKREYKGATVDLAAYRQQRVDQQMAMMEIMQEEQAALDAAMTDQWMQDQEDLFMSKQAYDAQVLAAEQAKYDAMSAMEKANYDRSQQYAKMDAQQKIGIAAGALGATAGMLGQAAALQDTQSKKGFERNKNLMIAQVAINTPSAAIGAFQALAPIPIVGPALGFAAAAAATGLGVAQMTKIKRTKFGGGGDVSKDATPRISAESGAGNQYGAGAQGGGQSMTINLLLDGTVVHSSMLKANDNAAQRGERSFRAA